MKISHSFVATACVISSASLVRAAPVHIDGIASRPGIITTDINPRSVAPQMPSSSGSLYGGPNDTSSTRFEARKQITSSTKRSLYPRGFGEQKSQSHSSQEPYSDADTDIKRHQSPSSSYYLSRRLGNYANPVFFPSLTSPGHGLGYGGGNGQETHSQIIGDSRVLPQHDDSPQQERQRFDINRSPGSISESPVLPLDRPPSPDRVQRRPQHLDTNEGPESSLESRREQRAAAAEKRRNLLRTGRQPSQLPPSSSSSSPLSPLELSLLSARPLPSSSRQNQIAPSRSPHNHRKVGGHDNEMDSSLRSMSSAHEGTGKQISNDRPDSTPYHRSVDGIDTIRQPLRSGHPPKSLPHESTYKEGKTEDRTDGGSGANYYHHSGDGLDNREQAFPPKHLPKPSPYGLTYGERYAILDRTNTEPSSSAPNHSTHRGDNRRQPVVPSHAPEPFSYQSRYKGTGSYGNEDQANIDPGLASYHRSVGGLEGWGQPFTPGHHPRPSPYGYMYERNHEIGEKTNSGPGSAFRFGGRDNMRDESLHSWHFPYQSTYGKGYATRETSQASSPGSTPDHRRIGLVGNGGQPFPPGHVPGPHHFGSTFAAPGPAYWPGGRDNMGSSSVNPSYFPFKSTYKQIYEPGERTDIGSPGSTPYPRSVGGRDNRGQPFPLTAPTHLPKSGYKQRSDVTDQTNAGPPISTSNHHYGGSVYDRWQPF